MAKENERERENGKMVDNQSEIEGETASNIPRESNKRLPLILLCGHTICLQSALPSSPSIPCHTCTHSTSALSLLPNSAILTCLTFLSTSCDLCSECGRCASVYCTECVSRYCDGCDSQAHTMRVLSRHERVSIEENGEAPSQCEEHGQVCVLYDSVCV